jgi:putative thiamine transport system permease protein
VTAWLKTVAPVLYPLVRLPVYAVIAYSSSVVDVALILGPSNPPPLSVAVVKWLNDPDLSRRFLASAGALLQLGVTMAALLAWRTGEAAVAWLARGWIEGGARRSGDGALSLIGKAGVAVAAAASALGLASLAVWSIAGLWRFPDLFPRTLTFERWASSVSLGGPLASTVLIGLVSTAASLIVVLAALEHETRRGHSAGKRALMILYLPLVVPPVAFLFGLVIAAEGAGIGPGFWPVVLGHVVFVLPYVYLSLSEAWRRQDRRYAMVAASLGADPDRTFVRIRLPMLLAPCLTAFAVGFAVSVGQYLATQLLGAGRVPTLTTEAVALSSGGDRRAIGVLAIAQSLLPALVFAVALAVPRLLWRNRRLLRGGG